MPPSIMFYTEQFEPNSCAYCILLYIVCSVSLNVQYTFIYLRKKHYAFLRKQCTRENHLVSWQIPP